MLMSTLRNVLRDEAGATAIEYGLIAALVSVVAVTALGSIGQALTTMYTNVSGVLANVATP